jgi:hypothetical protein
MVHQAYFIVLSLYALDGRILSFFVIVILLDMVTHYFHAFELHVTLFAFISPVVMNNLKVLHQLLQCPEILSAKLAFIFL